MLSTGLLGSHSTGCKIVPQAGGHSPSPGEILNCQYNIMRGRHQLRTRSYTVTGKNGVLHAAGVWSDLSPQIPGMFAQDALCSNSNLRFSIECVLLQTPFLQKKTVQCSKRSHHVVFENRDEASFLLLEFILFGAGNRTLSRDIESLALFCKHKSAVVVSSSLTTAGREPQLMSWGRPCSSPFHHLPPMLTLGIGWSLRFRKHLS